MNVIFTCGGTGGHINPAIAVANILKERHPDCNILFVGAKDSMEENLVPRAGYPLKAIRCAGISRRLSWKGIKWNMKAIGIVRKAMMECRKIIADFKPDVIVGTGGFASCPPVDLPAFRRYMWARRWASPSVCMKAMLYRALLPKWWPIGQRRCWYRLRKAPSFTAILRRWKWLACLCR